MKLKFLFLFILCSYTGFSKADLNKCILADKVSREFSLKAVIGKIDEAWKMMAPKSPTGKTKIKFDKTVKRQFAPLFGKDDVVFSVSTYGLERARCFKAEDKMWRYSDHRILFHIDNSVKDDSSGITILPISIEVRFIKGLGWRIYKFASTAL